MKRQSLLRSTILAVGVLIFTPTIGQSQDVNFTTRASLKQSMLSLTKGMTKAKKQKFDFAVYSLMLKAHPTFKPYGDLDIFGLVCAMGKSDVKKFYIDPGSQYEGVFSNINGRYDGITRELVLAEIKARAVTARKKKC